MVGERGFSMVETMIAIVVVGVLATVVLSGDAPELRFVGESFAETKADRLASGRIERLRAANAALVAGESDFDLPAEHVRGLVAARGRQRVREIEPGLFEVVVAISWRPLGAERRREVELISWMEGRR